MGAIKQRQPDVTISSAPGRKGKMEEDNLNEILEKFLVLSSIPDNIILNKIVVGIFF